MSIKYFRSSDGNNANDGSTWALDKAAVGDPSSSNTILAAGDKAALSSSHHETSASGTYLRLNGTLSNPTHVVSVDDTGDPEPPTASQSGAIIETTNATHIYVTGTGTVTGTAFLTGYGLYLNATGDAQQIYNNCTLKINHSLTGSAADINTGLANAGSAQLTEFNDCAFVLGRFNYHQIIVYGTTRINGGSISKPTDVGFGEAIFNKGASGESTDLIAVGVDMSSCPTDMAVFNYVAANIASASDAVIRRCKFPAGWSGQLLNGAILSAGPRFAMYDCDDGDTWWSLWIEEYGGSIRDETTLVRTGGAEVVHKMTALSVCSVATSLRSDRYAIPNTAVGYPITLDVHILHDSLTDLHNGDIWIDVSYKSETGSPLAPFATTKVASVFDATTDYANTTETWVTTGLTNPNKQKLSITVTPQNPGDIEVTVRLAKASTTVYVDPRVSAA